MKKYLIAGALALGLAAPVVAQVLVTQTPKGPVSRADYLALSAAHFAEIDTKHQGVITKEDLIAYLKKQFGRNPPPDLVDKIFSALDAKGDGKVTAAEVEAHSAARFDQWDTNHDGVLSQDEIDAGQQAMMAAHELQ